MRIDKAIESSMSMDDATWARHANPWSVWTRVPLLALLALAIWSRVWIGWWCLIPIAALIAWALYNPRAFPPPASLDNWASRAVLGERHWLARKTRPIPAHHARWAMILSILSAASILPLAYGLWVLDPWAAFAGAMLASVFKLWFCDRMAWLATDMATRTDP
ncbi:MAG: hypothetical protein KUA43_07560 [Hoeflea sp.]|uniref:DUF6653 family protein n=1 Tax=Hoeflea sp. TaxID=1940281 RepID=UPI001D7BC472|nr:DUF6653 family protein [Hoeflea sp.]MBU4530240.1 hypothetical protein [Alphaproteobacteria bacterium]MBU4542464.1 hypothetical protein [Alphaproteobacteria bacterium]MBU4551150.1 hypothetical protein [Alphaproteobacteria bacterium]MBV1723286.1 hypothetical protein [Hoeflea sp.]MBV1760256.1 hypothetical protein [Hoeflea sp.]